MQPGSPEDPTVPFHDRGQYIQVLAPSRTVVAYALVDEAAEAAAAAAAEKAKQAKVLKVESKAVKEVVKPAAEKELKKKHF